MHFFIVAFFSHFYARGSISAFIAAIRIIMRKTTLDNLAPPPSSLSCSKSLFCLFCALFYNSYIIIITAINFLFSSGHFTEFF